jgi:putative ABC transport system ATP-binding protein
MIKFKNVWKIYKIDGEIDYQALKGASFEIKKNEFVSIIGPSGSGKSTLMHLFGLLDKPTKGDIFIEGKNIISLDDNQLSTLRNEFVGFVFNSLT